MADPRFTIRTDNSEMMAAIAELRRRHAELSGPERDHFSERVQLIEVLDPAWSTNFWDASGAFHMTPGPKLLELIVPMESVGIPAAVRRPSLMARMLSQLHAMLKGRA